MQAVNNDIMKVVQQDMINTKDNKSFSNGVRNRLFHVGNLKLLYCIHKFCVHEKKLTENIETIKTCKQRHPQSNINMTGDV